MDLPVISEEEFLCKYSSVECRLFAPYVDGRDRQDKQVQMEKIGYQFETYISPHAQVWDASVKNCFIQELNNIQYGTLVGDGCSFGQGTTSDTMAELTPLNIYIARHFVW